MGTRRLPISVQAEVCEHMGTLLRSGFNVADALAFMTVRWPRRAPTFEQLIEAVSNGTELADALHAVGFAPVVSTQVALAGAHGSLADTLGTTAQYLQLIRRTRGRLWQLLMYPLVLLVVLGFLEVGIVYWVLPQLTQKQPVIPWPQIIVVAVIVGVCVLAIWFIRVLDSAGRYQLLRRWPVIGVMLTRYYQYEFTVGAGTFLRGGQDLAGYCRYLARLDAGPLTSLGRRVVDGLAEGEALNAVLKDPLVPAGVTRLLSLGQSQAEFAQTVETYAKGLFADLQARMNKMLALIQPLLFLVIGVQIVVMYTRLLLPLYSNIGGSY
ncbi:type II secretion system F family protein [uncultured Lacticaseibacillus sp.]|uniref:type II secretion system F family protein n=1 Tax=uncultured Lacticaseibacillus sp. TaxID=2775882 RepID=UPI0025963D8A|nr:type II secretion system F family protein [uncultured Lacticaseibacillus sp.]